LTEVHERMPYRLNVSAISATSRVLRHHDCRWKAKRHTKGIRN